MNPTFMMASIRHSMDAFAARMAELQVQADAVLADAARGLATADADRQELENELHAVSAHADQQEVEHQVREVELRSTIGTLEGKQGELRSTIGSLESTIKHQESVIASLTSGTASLHVARVQQERKAEARGAKAAVAASAKVKLNLDEETRAFFALLMEKERPAERANQKQLHLLIQNQLATLRSKSGRCVWHKEVLNWCADVYRANPGAYEHMALGGFLKLPHIDTVRKLAAQVCSCLSPLTSHLSPLASRLAPRASRLSPRASFLCALLDRPSLRRWT